MSNIISGQKTHKEYKMIPLTQIVGKRVEAVASSAVDGAWGQEPCVMLFFDDGTKHGFVLPNELNS